MKKIFDITDDEYDLIKKVMKETGIRTEIGALRYIFGFYKMNYDLTSEMRILKKIFRESEKREIEMYDAFNTILIKDGVEDCIPVVVNKSNVYKGSATYMKDQIARLKQIKDNKQNKQRKKGRVNE